MPASALLSEPLDVVMEALMLSQLAEVVHTHTEPSCEAVYGEFAALHPVLKCWMDRQGNRLFSHQAEALHLFSQGNNVVLATPTASGKSMPFFLAILDRLMKEPEATAVLVYPLKALGNDQLDKLDRMISEVQNLAFQLGFAREAHSLEGAFPSVYNGDTPESKRPRIRDTGRIIITTPDQLHSSLTANADKWERVVKNLRVLVLDEAHYYRGILGGDVGLTLRRLLRVLRAKYGNPAPRIIAATATIGNAQEHMERLTSLPFACVSTSGAPRGEKHFVLLNPVAAQGSGTSQELGSEEPVKQSVVTTISNIVESLLRVGLRFLVFVPYRSNVEWLYQLLQERLQSGKPNDRLLAQKLGAYRAGYDRRVREETEQKLRDGTYSAVITTSALELGIDIGTLDATVHLGLNASKASLYQQAGRAGRRYRASLALVVAADDPFNHFYLRQPAEYYAKPFEPVQLNPANASLLAKHLTRAAQECGTGCISVEPGLMDCKLFGAAALQQTLSSTQGFSPVVCNGSVVAYRWTLPPPPLFYLRDGQSDDILARVIHTGKKVELVDMRERVHKGAIFTHLSARYEVVRTEQRDDGDGAGLRVREAWLKPYDKYHYTVADMQMTVTETGRPGSVLQRPIGASGAATLCCGDVRVTVTCPKFAKLDMKSRKLVDPAKPEYPIEGLEPRVLDTKALWVRFAPGTHAEVLQAVTAARCFQPASSAAAAAAASGAAGVNGDSAPAMAAPAGPSVSHVKPEPADGSRPSVASPPAAAAAAAAAVEGSGNGGAATSSGQAATNKDVDLVVTGLYNLAVPFVRSLVWCDTGSNDLQGCGQATGQPEPVMFLWDNHQGGVGLCCEAFRSADEQLFARCLALLDSCTCTVGCIGCIQGARQFWPRELPPGIKAGCRVLLHKLVAHAPKQEGQQGQLHVVSPPC